MLQSPGRALKRRIASQGPFQLETLQLGPFQLWGPQEISLWGHVQTWGQLQSESCVADGRPFWAGEHSECEWAGQDSRRAW